MKTILFCLLIVLLSVVSIAAQSKNDAKSLDGKWQGKTATGRAVVLEMKVDGSQLLGEFTLVQKSTALKDGKVDGSSFSFTAGPLDGRVVSCSGRLVNGEVELAVQGVGAPLMLQRVK